MIPAAFAYNRASSVEEALGMLIEYGPDSKVIAGGQSLLPLMKLRLARPDRLIDIGRIESLRGVRALPDGRHPAPAASARAACSHRPARTSVSRPRPGSDW